MFALWNGISARARWQLSRYAWASSVCLGLCACPSSSKVDEETSDSKQLPQIGSATGIFQNTHASSFVSAIYDTYAHGGERFTTFVFVGEDPQLCDKLVRGEALEGVVLTLGETGQPWESHTRYSPGSAAELKALQTGIPNCTDSTRTLCSDRQGLRTVDAPPKLRFYISRYEAKPLQDNPQALLIGSAHVSSESGDEAVIKFNAHRCSGLADSALNWLQGRK